MTSNTASHSSPLHGIGLQRTISTQAYYSSSHESLQPRSSDEYHRESQPYQSNQSNQSGKERNQSNTNLLYRNDSEIEGYNLGKSPIEKEKRERERSGLDKSLENEEDGKDGKDRRIKGWNVCPSGCGCKCRYVIGMKIQDEG